MFICMHAFVSAQLRGDDSQLFSLILHVLILIRLADVETTSITSATISNGINLVTRHEPDRTTLDHSGVQVSDAEERADRKTLDRSDVQVSDSSEV